ncbi:MAG: histone H1 [Bacteroidota bacterium]|nr:histone H1 [Candidatus Kapabacteria bacterium]MDW8220109.1 histone H1 [Bacteroidota bacterium]
MNRYAELQALIRTFEQDFIKFYDKGNKEAGIRLRKHMQKLRAFAKHVRQEVQERKRMQKLSAHPSSHTQP